MSIGNSVKKMFNKLLKINGSDLSIYKNWSTPQMSLKESRAIKESQNKFDFPLETDIEKDDVIQIKDSKSFWKVLDIDENIQYGTATSLNARVIKIDHLGNEISINAQGKAVFNGDVYGGVQVGGQNNTQTNTVNINSNFTQAINELLALIENSSLNSVQKNKCKIRCPNYQRFSRFRKIAGSLAISNIKNRGGKRGNFDDCRYDFFRDGFNTDYSGCFWTLNA